MQIEIQNSREEDIAKIFALYDDGIAYQKKVGNNHWLGFERALILQEIGEDRHYKIVHRNDIVATFCITLSDPLIWKEANDIPAIYIHRIATSQAFRGNNLFKDIVNWARKFAQIHNLLYIRMDTGAGNDRLINHYINNGFKLIGSTTVDYMPGLPAHYKDGVLALLQMQV